MKRARSIGRAPGGATGDLPGGRSLLGHTHEWSSGMVKRGSQGALPFSLEDTFSEGSLVEVGTGGDLRTARGGAGLTAGHRRGDEQGVEFFEHHFRLVLCCEQFHHMALERVVGYRSVDLPRVLALRPGFIKALLRPACEQAPQISRWPRQSLGRSAGSPAA